MDTTLTPKQADPPPMSRSRRRPRSSLHAYEQMHARDEYIARAEEQLSSSSRCARRGHRGRLAASGLRLHWP